jgi:hypothetical protein
MDAASTSDAAATTPLEARPGRDRLFDHVNLIVVPSLLLLLLARHFGMIAAVPTWEIVGSLFLKEITRVRANNYEAFKLSRSSSASRSRSA